MYHRFDESTESYSSLPGSVDKMGVVKGFAGPLVGRLALAPRAVHLDRRRGLLKVAKPYLPKQDPSNRLVQLGDLISIQYP